MDGCCIYTGFGPPMIHLIKTLITVRFWHQIFVGLAGFLFLQKKIFLL